MNTDKRSPRRRHYQQFAVVSVVFMVVVVWIFSRIFNNPIPVRADNAADGEIPYREFMTNADRILSRYVETQTTLGGTT